MRLTKVYWQTKDGKQIELSEMSDGHIKNCIKMLQRSLEFGNIKDMNIVCERRLALYYFKQELSERQRRLNRDLNDKLNGVD